MKNNSRKYAVVGIVSFVLVTGGIAFLIFYQQAEKIPIHEQSPVKDNSSNQPINNPPESYYPNNESKNKILAELIKDDLKDALEKDSKWYGTFMNYTVLWDGIQIHSGNDENIKRLTEENFERNISKRKDKLEKEKKKDFERTGRPWVISDEFWEELEKIKIYQDELELADYQEIASLINQIRKLWEESWGLRVQELKLNSREDLFYGCIDGKKQKVINRKLGLYQGFLANKNGKNYTLWVPDNHPALTKYKDQKSRFYLISGVDKLSLEPSPYIVSRFDKWVDLKDDITISHYNF